MGVWIEMLFYLMKMSVVAARVGVWVEMQQFLRETTSERSHPTWVCGLKYTVCEWMSIQQ